MDQKSRRRGALAIFLVALVLATAAGAKKKKTVYMERYTARALSMGTVAPGASAFVEIAISRWTTDEEREALARALAEEGPKKLAEALEDQEEVGFIRLPQTLAQELRYARELRRGDQRHLILATDRPLALGEIRSNTRSRDYDISIIELRLDADGKGDGSFAVAVEVSVDPESRTLQLESYSSEPVRLLDVRRRKK